MTTFADVCNSWDQADPKAIHPLRNLSEEAYWDSGKAEAVRLSTYLKGGGKVIDFGCGDGRVAVPLQQLTRREVIGVDSSPQMISRLPDTITGIVNDGTDLVDAVGGKVSGLFALAILIHHDYGACHRLIEQFSRVVRVGGTIILDWPVADTPSQRSHWIGVTTWSRTAQEQIEHHCNLTRVDAPDLPYAAYRVGK